MRNRIFTLMLLCPAVLVASNCVKEVDPWANSSTKPKAPSRLFAEVTPGKMNYSERLMQAQRYAKDKQNGDAEDLFLACIKEAEGFGPKDPRLAEAINETAYFYYLTLYNYDKALEMFERLVKVRTELLGADNMEVANDILKLGDYWTFQKEYEKAESYYKQAIEIIEKHTEPEAPAYKERIFHDYSKMLEAVKRDAEAAEWEKRAKSGK